MTRRVPRGVAEALLIVGSLAFWLAIAGLGELAVRAFSSVDLLGNSRDLFVAGAYGTSYGNAPNSEAISFGQPVYTDEHGFRVPKGGVPGDERKSQAILILGDSVAFGSAVEESQTLAGLLRARFSDMRVYNSAVIGYSTPNYREVAMAFVPEHPEIRSVVLVYCLNDITAGSAQNIDRYLGNAKPAARERDITETLRSFAFFSDLNDYLRSRSKLYLLVRHRLLATQTRDWKRVLELYQEDRQGDVEQAARDVAAIAAFLAPRGIRFVVVLAPFEYQLRAPDDPQTPLPQRRIGELLAKAGVVAIDPRSAFDASVPSADYFLAYDPMHFSAAGHRVMAGVVGDALAAITPGARSPARS